MCLIIKKIKLLKLSVLNRWIILICIYNCLHNPQPQRMFLDWDGGECTDTTENIKFSVCVNLSASPLKEKLNWSNLIHVKIKYFWHMRSILNAVTGFIMNQNKRRSIFENALINYTCIHELLYSVLIISLT